MLIFLKKQEISKQVALQIMMTMHIILKHIMVLPPLNTIIM